jgi:hypothetical protein
MASDVADRAGACLLLGFLGVSSLIDAFHRPDWFDTVAYGLPAANLVERGVLSLPQLGPQLGLDRYYLLNSPWMLVAPAPFFWALGSGRVSFLIGLYVLALATLAAYAWAVRRGLRLKSWSATALLACAFFCPRVLREEIANQRYCVLFYAALLLAFVPVRTADGHRPWWRWLAAGSLGLFHPLGLVGLVTWSLSVAVEAASQADRGVPRLGSRWQRAVGPALFVLMVGLTVAWFARLEALRTQFLPHLTFDNFRQGQPFKGVFVTETATIFAIPGWITNLSIAGTALAMIVVAILRPSIRPRVAPALPAAATIAVVLGLDAWKGIGQANYFYLGLAPCLLFPLGASRRRRAVVLATAALAIASLAVKLYLDRKNRPDLGDTPEAVRFVVEHSRPGDRIIAGPPFILLAARRELPGGRTIARVVPQPYYLASFDERTFRNEIRALGDVYLGEPLWFRRPVYIGPEGPPLFDRATPEELTFRGSRVIRARSPHP